jgi:alpha-1,2-mannosyltransferase
MRGRVAASLVLLVVAVWAFDRHYRFFDMAIYQDAIRWWRDGGDLYGAQTLGFTYPPFAALVLSPLAAMPWPVAVVASVVVHGIAVGLLLRWFAGPVLRRYGRSLWTPYALAFLAVLVFEPARDTFSYGQINLVLLVLACADLRGLPNGRWAGAGIGLAAAIKLTPAIFIGYLLISRQYRAAATATVTAAGVTLLTAVIAPHESLAFWGGALWDTDRVGRLEYVSNQSLRGVLARLDAPSLWWPVAVLLVLAFWCWAVRATSRPAGFAITGIVGCLVSPITWVHHLVWLMPALFLLIDRAVAAPPAVRRRRLIGLGAVYLVLSSSLVWMWWSHPLGWAAFPGSNAYVWVSLGLLAALTVNPLRARLVSVAAAYAGRSARWRPAGRSPSPSAYRADSRRSRGARRIPR